MSSILTTTIIDLCFVLLFVFPLWSLAFLKTTLNRLNPNPVKTQKLQWSRWTRKCLGNVKQLTIWPVLPVLFMGKWYHFLKSSDSHSETISLIEDLNPLLRTEIAVLRIYVHIGDHPLALLFTLKHFSSPATQRTNFANWPLLLHQLWLPTQPLPLLPTAKVKISVLPLLLAASTWRPPQMVWQLSLSQLSRRIQPQLRQVTAPHLLQITPPQQETKLQLLVLTTFLTAMGNSTLKLQMLTVLLWLAILLPNRLYNCPRQQIY